MKARGNLLLLHRFGEEELVRSENSLGRVPFGVRYCASNCQHACPSIMVIRAR